jgi:hypothetical protein
VTISNGYCTLAEFKNFDRITSTDATDDGVIESIIEMASRFIDWWTGRRFYATSASRYFDAPDTRDLWLDEDLISVTSVTNGDGTAIASGEYQLLPLNESPKYAIRLKASSSVSWTGDSNGNTEGVVTVAGSWGYASSTPSDIKNACMLIAASVYRKRFGATEGGGKATITAGGVVLMPETMPAAAQAMLTQYRKMVIG